MTKVSIDPELLATCPRVALACVTADVVTRPSSAELDQELRTCEERVLKLPEPKAVLESPAILATRAAYRALGKDPARYRGSAEALLRRVIAGKGLPRVNNVVDVINVVSVESRLPIGLYDLQHVQGDIVFRAGRAGETYKGIGKYDLNLEGLPIFCDAQGPHGSPTSDSERTMVTEATRQVLGIIMSFGGSRAAGSQGSSSAASGSQGLPAAADRLAALLKEHAAAKNVEAAIVSGT
jgi:DNA/RNA-binding domain of Phe-tRNA-synthetase-like protein